MLNLPDLRKALELQFKHKFYNDPMFPWLPSLGILDILQGFDYNNTHIGTLHLKYTKREVDSIWLSTWIDRPIDAINLAQQIQREKPYDENMVVNANLMHIQNKYENKQVPINISTPRYN
jgi:hypothetical protein